MFSKFAVLVFSFSSLWVANGFVPLHNVPKIKHQQQNDNRIPSSSSTTTTTTTRFNLTPLDTTDLFMAADQDFGSAAKTVLIALTLGGGLIPALISANASMFKTLAGSKYKEDEAEDVANMKPGESFDPTVKETKYRKYISDSGATGPELPFSSLLFAPDKIPLADVVAVLGRIQNLDTLADWKNLPSTKMRNVSLSDPPMWLPRKAFKVNIRKAKFLGWPTDPKTGQPIGGEELKAAEQGRISKQDALISDAALDAVFDSWAWGASVATPDKVAKTLSIYKPSPTEVNLSEFISAAVRGRSVTALSAVTFIVIQIVVFGSLFIGPALRMFFDIDIGFGSLGSSS